MKWFVAAALMLAWCGPARGVEPPVRVGSKNFTEQEILGEIVAHLLERSGTMRVERRFGLGGSDICHAALRNGQLDIYIEYTGTAMLSILRLESASNGTQTFLTVASEYRERYELEWLPPIGFNNTYAITVRGSEAAEFSLRTISDLKNRAPSLKAGFTSEFMERPDGYPGLREKYGFVFGEAVDLDPGLMYQALADGQVDVICAFATDGRIADYGLVTLRDDLGFFPPYDAAPVVRASTLQAHPEIRDALAAIAGTIRDEDMRRMNRAVDVLGREPAEVAREWVEEHIGSGEGTAGAAARSATPKGFFALFAARRREIGAKTLEHLGLTALGTCIAVVIGVPLGVVIHRRRSIRGPVLAITEIVQTIPSLAITGSITQDRTDDLADLFEALARLLRHGAADARIESHTPRRPQPE